MYKVYILKEEIYSEPISYLLKVMGDCLDLKFSYIENKDHAQYVFDHTDPISIPINYEFFRLLLIEKKYNFNNYFENVPIIYFRESQKEDWLSSAFYIVNSFQEYRQGEGSNEYDIYGRFKFESSFQSQFSCIEQNLVQEYFISFCKRDLNLVINKSKLKKSRVFLSHDIDSVNGSFFQDGLWAIKRGRLDIVLKLVFNEILLKPDWKNIDKITKIHSEYGLISTFFWLASNKIGNNNIKNSDYSLNELRNLSRISKSNGLHKSSMPTDLNTEINSLPFETNFNRYHFLKFEIPEDWEKLNNSNILLDASLGFAERFGFRNCYGLPFRPYNLISKSSFNFIEVPLNIMDGTFQKYMELPVEKTSEIVIDFLEGNSINSVISILWHNTFFTNYKYRGYLEEYKKILTYMVENQIESISPTEIIETYGK